MTKIDWSDRYGGGYPDPNTVCLGKCEGMGCIPVYHRPEGTPRRRLEPRRDRPLDPELLRLWLETEAKSPSDNGYHFIVCPTCEGTGKRNN